MFAGIADRYDRMNHLLSMNVDRYWRRRVIRAVPAEGESPILDVCTGTGDLALAYWRATGGRVPIVAADFCREMLCIGEEKVERVGGRGMIRFIEADVQQLPLPDNRFQIVCVAFGLRNIADPQQALCEMTRVCQPGGRVAVLEFSWPERTPLKQLYGWYFRRVLPRIGQWLARDEQQAYSYLPASVAEFPSGEVLAQQLRQAGLGAIDYYPLTGGIATLYVGAKRGI